MTANINEAASYFRDYANISESLTSQNIALNIAEMEVIFQNKNKQQQIDAQDVLLNAAAKQRLWLVFGLFLLGLVALLLLIIYRNKRKAAAVLAAYTRKWGDMTLCFKVSLSTRA